MPIIEFLCEGCEEVTEVFTRNIHDKVNNICGCGGELKQLFKGAPVIFIGAAPISFHRKFSLPHTDGIKP